MNLTKEKIGKVIHHPTTKMVAVGTAGFAGGIIVGFVLARAELRGHGPKGGQEVINAERWDEIRARREKLKAVELVQEAAAEDSNDVHMITEGKDFVTTFGKGGQPVQEVGREEDLVDSLEPVPQPEDEPELIRQNVFAQASADNDDWDYEKEKRSRTSTEPYILHKDEFYADEMGYRQLTFVYYDGDDILADEDDKPVYNHFQQVGELRFGHGSGSDKVVYIRSEKRKEEYEIVKEPGLFSKEVLGLDIENNDRVKGRNLEHSDAPRRFPLKG